MATNIAPATADLEVWAAAEDCPSCKAHGLVIDWRMVLRPFNALSLAGVQLKTSGRLVPWLRCPACGVEGKGH